MTEEVTVEHFTLNKYDAPPSPKTDRLVGLEIEVEKVGATYIDVLGVSGNSTWGTTVDNSLRNNGVEFLSKPIPTAAVGKAVKDLYKGWAKGWASTVRTGIHVHVDVRDFTLPDLRAFLTTYCLLEPALFDFVGPEREEGIYCVPWYRAPNEISRLASGLASGNLMAFINTTRDCSKYSALFTNPLYKFGTVEFRHAPTWTDAGVVTEWAYMCAALANFSKGKTATNIFKRWNEGPSGFVFGILGRVPQDYEDRASSLDCDFLAMKMAGLDIDEKDWKRLQETIPGNFKNKLKKKKPKGPEGPLFPNFQAANEPPSLASLWVVAPAMAAATSPPLDPDIEVTEDEDFYLEEYDEPEEP